MTSKGTSFSMENLFICMGNIYCESILISLSTWKIDDFNITLIYGIPAKKVKCKNESPPQNFLTDKI